MQVTHSRHCDDSSAKMMSMEAQLRALKEEQQQLMHDKQELQQQLSNAQDAVKVGKQQLLVDRSRTGLWFVRFNCAGFTLEGKLTASCVQDGFMQKSAASCLDSLLIRGCAC